jgi:hypothetical protein
MVSPFYLICFYSHFSLSSFVLQLFIRQISGNGYPAVTISNLCSWTFFAVKLAEAAAAEAKKAAAPRLPSSPKLSTKLNLFS